MGLSGFGGLRPWKFICFCVLKTHFHSVFFYLGWIFLVYRYCKFLGKFPHLGYLKCKFNHIPFLKMNVVWNLDGIFWEHFRSWRLNYKQSERNIQKQTYFASQFTWMELVRWGWNPMAVKISIRGYGRTFIWEINLEMTFTLIHT